MDNAKENNLTDKQENFAQCVALKGMNYSDAYRECYDVKTENPNTIWRKAYDISQNGKVSARIEELRSMQLKEVMLSTSQILKMYNNIATANIEDAYDDEGNFHLEWLPKGCVKQVRRNKEGKIIGAELYDKQKSLDKIADLYGIGDKLQTSADGVEIKFRDELEDYSE